MPPWAPEMLVNASEEEKRALFARLEEGRLRFVAKREERLQHAQEQLLATQQTAQQPENEQESHTEQSTDDKQHSQSQSDQQPQRTTVTAHRDDDEQPVQDAASSNNVQNVQNDNPSLAKYIANLHKDSQPDSTDDDDDHYREVLPRYNVMNAKASPLDDYDSDIDSFHTADNEMAMDASRRKRVTIECFDADDEWTAFDDGKVPSPPVRPPTPERETESSSEIPTLDVLDLGDDGLEECVMSRRSHMRRNMCIKPVVPEEGNMFDITRETEVLSLQSGNGDAPKETAEAECIKCEQCTSRQQKIDELEMHLEALESALAARAMESVALRAKSLKGNSANGIVTRLRDENDSLRLTVDFLVRELLTALFARVVGV